MVRRSLIPKSVEMWGHRIGLVAYTGGVILGIYVDSAFLQYWCSAWFGYSAAILVFDYVKERKAKASFKA